MSGATPASVTGPIAPAAAAADLASDWRRALVWLAFSASVILALFHQTALHLLDLWWNSSTYSHCLLIGPIIGWLVWLRAPELVQLRPRGWPPALLWIGGGAALWLVGDAASVSLFGQLGLIVMLQGLVPAILGPQVARGLLFPLFYAFFMLPFGEELVPPMQLLTADMAMALLRLIGIPAHLDGIFITTPAGLFAVAEACSGVKFLVAMAALSVLAAHLCFIGWRRRALFILFALVVPVLANGVRAFGTIWMAEIWGIGAAVGADHVIYGWFFFGFVMLLIALAARPWFNRAPDATGVDAASLQRFWPGRGVAPALAACLALTVAAIPPLLDLVASATARPMAVARWEAPPGWTAIAVPDEGAVGWRARFDGADQRIDQRYVGPDGSRVDVTLVGYARQGEGREIVGYGQGAVDPDGNWRWGHSLEPIGPARVDRIAITGAARDVMTLYSVGSDATANSWQVKWLTLRARLTGGNQHARALLISAPARPGQGGREQIAAFVAAGGGSDAMVRRLTQPD